MATSQVRAASGHKRPGVTRATSRERGPHPAKDAATTESWLLPTGQDSRLQRLESELFQRFQNIEDEFTSVHTIKLAETGFGFEVKPKYLRAEPSLKFSTFMLKILEALDFFFPLKKNIKGKSSRQA